MPDYEQQLGASYEDIHAAYQKACEEGLPHKIASVIDKLSELEQVCALGITLAHLEDLGLSMERVCTMVAFCKDAGRDAYASGMYGSTNEPPGA